MVVEAARQLSEVLREKGFTDEWARLEGPFLDSPKSRSFREAVRALREELESFDRETGP